ncbi:hypothetical protein OG394_31880 [Kribbella sp. NBC_01245]|uniref:hypothetical protein n=1 Tax=Kribbella sp. NBC_01245 TaxID=2903578 RepID=UPI002E2AA86D|nr:hypothetical protein [Kribbella sp. NBC_01245]
MEKSSAADPTTGGTTSAGTTSGGATSGGSRLDRLRLGGFRLGGGAAGGDRRLPVLAWALSVLLVVALAGLVVAVVALRQQDTRNDRRLTVMQSARQITHDFTTYKYDTWDADAQRVIDGSTGQFKQEFSNAAGSLKTTVVSGKVTSTGEVLEAAVQSVDTDSAQILVVADAVVNNAGQDGAKRRHYRIKLEMVREGDRWLVADLQAVG